MPQPSAVVRAVAVAGASLVCLSCAQTIRRTLSPGVPAFTPDTRPAYLKAHFRDGGVCVFDRWETLPSGAGVRGHGALLDANRDTLFAGELEFPADSVALFESNRFEPSGR